MLRVLSGLLFVVAILSANDLKMHYFVNQFQAPIDITKKANCYIEFIKFTIDKNNSVKGEIEYYPYQASYTKNKFIGTFNSKKSLITANHNIYYYKNNRLYLYNNYIEECNKEDFTFRYQYLIRILSKYSHIDRMRKLHIGVSTLYEDLYRELKYYVFGLERTSNFDLVVDINDFLFTLKDALHIKRDVPMTKEQVMKHVKQFKKSDFKNTADLTHPIDGLILFNNYLKREMYEPFSGEHYEQFLDDFGLLYDKDGNPIE